MISERVLVVGAGPMGAVERALAGMRGSLANPRYAPCPLLRRYVAAGRLGRKSGRRFYEYA